MGKSEQQRLEGIDPNQVPSSMEQRQIVSMKHPEGRLGILKYDRLSLTLNVAAPGEGPTITNDKPIQTFKGKWTGDPERVEIIEEKFLNRDQPFVGTCSRPIKERNMGCFSHNGCPYPDPADDRGRGPGPFNVVMEKDGQRHSCPCYHFYHGVRRGLPTSQVHYAYNGYRIDQDSITVPSVKARMVKDEWGSNVYQDEEIELPVDRLGPMYAQHFGKKREKVKVEKAVEGREEMDDVGTSVNSKPGTLGNAPRTHAVQSVKIGH